jgi:disulfide bond formation protein DsbB
MTARSVALYIAWLVAVTATVGSLYFSEVRMFVPCVLCWWQRVFMYPLVIVLGVATFRQDFAVWRTALPLATIGGSISIYHYLIQKIPGLAGPTSCASGVPCNAQYINWFGFLTIPFLAGTAFVLITTALVFIAVQNRKDNIQVTDGVSEGHP